jgi:hypothetical protein
MEVDTECSVDIVWQALVSVLIQQKTCGVLREVLDFRRACADFLRSRIARSLWFYSVVKLPLVVL